MDYDTLVKRVLDTIDYDEQDIRENINSFITTAENKISLHTDLDFFHKGSLGENTASIMVSRGSGGVLPPDYLAPLEVTSADGWVMDKFEPGALRTLYPNGIGSEPRVYAIVSEKAIVVAPIPVPMGNQEKEDTDTATIVLRYKGAPESVVPDADDSQQNGTRTTWLSLNASVFLLYRVLFEAAVYIGDGELQQTFSTEYEKALSDLRETKDRQRTDASEMPPRKSPMEQV